MFYQLNSRFTKTYCLATSSAGCFFKNSRYPPSSVDEKAKLHIHFQNCPYIFLLLTVILYFICPYVVLRSCPLLLNIGTIQATLDLWVPGNNWPRQAHTVTYKMHNYLRITRHSGTSNCIDSKGQCLKRKHTEDRYDLWSFLLNV